VSKPTSPTLIGAFVLGAVFLLVVAVLVFGGTELLTRKAFLVSYFPDSVKGLRTGSNVVLRGVRVGYVKEIRLEGRIDNDGETLTTLVEVVMEVEPASFALFARGERLEQEQLARIPAKKFVDAGFRAKLGVDSFVTGQLLVELDFNPETEAIFRGEDPPYPEVPTIPSDVQQALERVQQFLGQLSEKVDIDRLLGDVQGIASGLNALANSDDLKQALAGASRLTNTDVPALIESLRDTTNQLQQVLRRTGELVEHVDARVDPIAEEIVPTIRRLQSVLASGESTLQAATRQLKSDSTLALEVGATLEEVQGAARAVRVLLDYVERHPEAFLRGKESP
jgi:paraquat-inducible protein B